MKPNEPFLSGNTVKESVHGKKLKVWRNRYVETEFIFLHDLNSWIEEQERETAILSARSLECFANGFETAINKLKNDVIK